MKEPEIETTTAKPIIRPTPDEVAETFFREILQTIIPIGGKL